MGIWNTYKDQPFVQIPLPSESGLISPEQRRFEELAREKGFQRPSDMNWADCDDIKQQINREKRGDYPAHDF